MTLSSLGSSGELKSQLRKASATAMACGGAAAAGVAWATAGAAAATEGSGGSSLGGEGITAGAYGVGVSGGFLCSTALVVEAIETFFGAKSLAGASNVLGLLGAAASGVFRGLEDDAEN